MSTTTSCFQIQSDFYSSKTACEAEWKRTRTQTNPRYKFFKQTHFTAGDPEQFHAYRGRTIRSSANKHEEYCNNIHVPSTNVFSPEFAVDTNMPTNKIFDIPKVFQDGDNACVGATFDYLFHKFKKGIFVKICDNRLVVFLPFSKAYYTNEWAEHVKIDPRYKDVIEFMRGIYASEGRPFFPDRINTDQWKWVANNCLVRYEYPVLEKDTNVHMFKNMLEELCASRDVPDTEFFINRRDFPVITTDGLYEPYNHIYGTTKYLIRDNKNNNDDSCLSDTRHKKFAPVFSMSKSERYDDMLFPTYDDWARVKSIDDSVCFPPSAREYTDDAFETNWDVKVPTAVFRGSSTGAGVTVDTNARLRIAHMSQDVCECDTTDGASHDTTHPLLDAGITAWKLRPRKLETSRYLQTICVGDTGLSLVPELLREEQSKYKYIVNVEGHVSAYRLSCELATYSVILLVASEWKLWFTDMLKPYTHYVPVKSDLSDLYDRIRWCKKNDAACKQIALNARAFYDTYLGKQGILDYIQRMLIETRRVNTVPVVYPQETALDICRDAQMKWLSSRNKACSTLDNCRVIDRLNAEKFPCEIKRGYALLGAFETAFQHINFTSSHQKEQASLTLVFKNKTSRVEKTKFGWLYVAIKTTCDARKMREHVNELFIARACTNSLMKSVPNFCYVFGTTTKIPTNTKQLETSTKPISVVSEFIKGQSMFEYIRENAYDTKRDELSKSFVSEITLMMLQLAGALHAAQCSCEFVHNDLTPWNIMIKKTDNPWTVDYLLPDAQSLRVETTLVPVIIDYGKSHVVYNGAHYGTVNMLRTSTIQDIIVMLVSIIHVIGTTLSHYRCDVHSIKSAMVFEWLVQLANFMTGTAYAQQRFETWNDVTRFTRDAHKYSNLVYSDKCELEQKTPVDFIQYVLDNNTDNTISDVVNTRARIDACGRLACTQLEHRQEISRRLITSWVLSVCENERKCINSGSTENILIEMTQVYNIIADYLLKAHDKTERLLVYTIDVYTCYYIIQTVREVLCELDECAKAFKVDTSSSKYKKLNLCKTEINRIMKKCFQNLQTYNSVHAVLERQRGLGLEEKINQMHTRVVPKNKPRGMVGGEYNSVNSESDVNKLKKVFEASVFNSRIGDSKSNTHDDVLSVLCYKKL